MIIIIICRIKGARLHNFTNILQKFDSHTSTIHLILFKYKIKYKYIYIIDVKTIDFATF